MKTQLSNAVLLPLDQLEQNKGQVDGLPANPRLIKNDKYKKLVQSIKDNPEMLSLRELLVYEYTEGRYIIIGGNMRCAAMRELKYKDAPCKIIPADATVEQLKAYTIKDNSGFGEWDFDMLANEWDADLLCEWGVDVGGMSEEVEKVIAQASSDVATADYSEDTNYNLTDLYRSRCNPEINKAIADGIKKKQIRPEIADVLTTRMTQCAIFNFDEIIKYYRSKDATATEKELLRRLYLVFVAPKEMFDAGILKINNKSNVIYDDELVEKYEDNGKETD